VPAPSAQFFHRRLDQPGDREVSVLSSGLTPVEPLARVVYFKPTEIGRRPADPSVLRHCDDRSPLIALRDGKRAYSADPGWPVAWTISCSTRSRMKRAEQT
jgi:hypothetical protein